MTMHVIDGLENLPERPEGCAVAIGNFDGVHRGHQSIIAQARRLADAEGARMVAVTFQPPPIRLLAPEKAPPPLMRMAQRVAALTEAGAHVVLILRTTHDLLNMAPEPFVRDVLVARLGPRHVVEGPNFFFGHNRAGDVHVLAELGERYGFQTHVVPQRRVDLPGEAGVVVSSSLIRRLVGAGRVEDAAACLGRPYAMQGVVVAGRGRGRSMHCPTANLDCGLQLVPADGVYAGLARWADRRVVAAVSIGDQPTFGDGRPAVEAHLLDTQADLYGQPMTLELHRYLRAQQRFDSPEQLRIQMERDVALVRQSIQ